MTTSVKLFIHPANIVYSWIFRRNLRLIGGWAGVVVNNYNYVCPIST